MIHQLQPALGQRQPATSALEKNRSQLVFQCADLSSERGLRHAKSPRSSRQRSFFCRNQKGPGPVSIEVDGFPIHAKLHTK